MNKGWLYIGILMGWGVLMAASPWTSGVVLIGTKVLACFALVFFTFKQYAVHLHSMDGEEINIGLIITSFVYSLAGFPLGWYF